jgi:hypothetical protein
MDEDISFKEFFEREIKNLLNNSQVSYAKSMQNALTALIQFEDNLGNYKFENIDFQFLTNFENFIREEAVTMAESLSICEIYAQSITEQ